MTDASKRPGRPGSRVDSTVDLSAAAVLQHAREGLPCAVSFVGEALGRVNSSGYLRVAVRSSEASEIFVELSVRIRGGLLASSEVVSTRSRVQVSGSLTLVETPPVVQVLDASVIQLPGTGPLTRWRDAQRRRAGIGDWRRRQGVNDVIEQVQEHLRTTLADWPAATPDPRRVLFVGRESIQGFTDIVADGERLRERFTVGEAALSGRRAANDIAAVLAEADPARHLLVVLSRGGGSVTDLAVLDDARVLTAIQACRVPVLAAVGHTADKDLLVDRVCTWSLPVPRNVRDAVRAPLLGEPTRAQHRERDRADKAAAEQQHAEVLRELARQRASIDAHRTATEVERCRADVAERQVGLTQESAAAHRLGVLARQRTLGLAVIAPLVVLAAGYVRTMIGADPGPFGLLGPGVVGWVGGVTLVLLAALAWSSPRWLRRRPWVLPRRSLCYDDYGDVRSIRRFNQVYASIHRLEPRLQFTRRGR